MGSPVTIIAEIGINFNGDFDTCLALIDAAAAAGCDVAKFQVFSADTLYPRSAGVLAWKDENGAFTYDIFTAVKKNELPREWVAPLMAHCERRGIGFLASVFSADDARFLVKAGATALKISSSSVRNLPLVDACAAFGVPLIVSTGGSRLGEVEDVVDTVCRHHDRLTLLHCSLQYPTPPEDCHLGAIGTLAAAFPRVAVGYSDHTAHATAAPVQAVTLGARVIEKHITLDRRMPGPDHFFALEPDELAAMVAGVRSAEAGLAAGEVEAVDPVLFGSSAKRVEEGERYLRDFVANQIFVRRAIAKGDIITTEDLLVLRRGEKGAGLAPKYLSLFAGYTVRAARDIEAEAPMDWGCIL
ncbi:MAG: N-acetylneuraminate synthase family protein [Desulfobacterales bacterium]|nr:N-acetylneuraminate synthase family protein [Desulfobacterales bacterium]